MELRFDFAENDARTGFRLDEFSLYNWGTYDKQIVKFSLDKHNGLLTGDIGSGKSTIVDALTTLLVPHQKITFNKAAGADAKERTLRSYILGEYKSAQDDSLGNAKAVALRDESSFTVLLARFFNEGYDESFTVAQFFHIKNRQVQKFFITSKNELAIKEDFLALDFSDTHALKKHLRTKPHTQVYDSFSDYSKDFKRSMGIKNDQALNLFYQTVSLKSIGNLTSFVREHMLESSDIDTKIDELCKNFAELNHSHNLVLRAKEQIVLLEPIDKEAKGYEKHVRQKEQSETMRNALSSYFATHKTKLLHTKIQELTIELQKSESVKQRVDEALENESENEVALRVELQKNGGDRIKELEDTLKQTQKILKDKKEKNSHYNTLAKKLAFPTVSNEHRFLKNITLAEDQLNNLEGQKTKLTNENILNSSVKSRYEEERTELEDEIHYLEENRSNIPKKLSSLRDTMAEKLSFNVTELPFAGELIEVTDTEWQGAIERVMYSFSLSLIVDEKYYDSVSEYVNATHLGTKLVYLKVSHQTKRSQFFEKNPASLLGKIKIKANSVFFAPLETMIQERFDISCVESMREFRKYKKALTKNGQFKSNYIRHEKDDRFDINDTSRWTLGWDNTNKIKALQNNVSKLQEKIVHLTRIIVQAQNNLITMESQRDALRDILQFKHFVLIDWYNESKNIERYESELIELQKSSNILQTLRNQLNEVQKKMTTLRSQSNDYSKKLGSLESKMEGHRIELSTLATFQPLDSEVHSKIEELFTKEIQESLHLGNIAHKERELRGVLQKKIDLLAKKIGVNSQKLLSQMNSYTNRFSVESKEFDPSLESLGDFRAKLKELKKDDLPRFEKRFKELFKEKTIQKTAMIQAELEFQSKEIASKIAKINNSLRDIEYNSGTYIELVAENSNIREIRDFKQDLKSAISYAISDDNSYDEAKFLQIKELIDRFNGREGYSEVDKRWRALVSDVRNWFDFSASERFVSDGSEKEYYAHSGGKSGGQKEKLAYTVLASSLAFQFGLEHNEIRSRSFRFVMIDEAFGKGSDESTKYALQLFEKLNLQLLVITPKTKINVIEPFVRSLHFVHNKDGMYSSLLSMKIEEYQEKREDALNAL